VTLKHLRLAVTVRCLGLCIVMEWGMSAVIPFSLQAQTSAIETFQRDPNQAVDESYTEHISKYTTAPALNSPLTDYLPASSSVPTPAEVLGDVAGAPDVLPYAEEVHRYFRLLAAASPRVKVFTIGHSEEGREMIAVAVADESLLAQANENGARLAQLADPRILKLDDVKAQALISQSFPVYYITGTIHSPETGAPTALMELAYRLAVDNAPYVQYIRSHLITLITPVVEVDGRDRMVDIYKWHKAHPGQNWPYLVYWGHYVAHDNNRDAMALTLNLSRNVLDTYLAWHAQVLHDLHESVPFLYDNTAGDGPYNSWIDPILTNEWSMLASDNMARMQSFGMPGAFTHGTFDTWSPGYLMFLASLHNGISRLYETFGNGGADTEKRVLSPDQYARTWYRPNPPYPTVLWSQRDNNNYEQTALLSTLSYFAQNASFFLNNFYRKSKRSVEKPLNEGPAAYVVTQDDRARNRQMQLLKVLALQHVEIHRLTQAVTVALPPPPHKEEAEPKPATPPPPTSQTFASGSLLIRMDQPFSRVADALLDRQFWSPEDPQKKPYDDTGWSFGDLFNAHLARVTDRGVLAAPMSPVTDLRQIAAAELGAGPFYVVNNSAQVSLVSLVYALRDSADVSVCEEKFESAGHKFTAGSLIIGRVPTSKLKPVLQQFDLDAVSMTSLPSVKVHPAAAPRIAFMHAWLSTQKEGWWRLVFDQLQVPFAYLSTQTVAREENLRSNYDVIIFAPVAYASTQQIVDGLPMWGNPLPWQTTPLTPNLGKLDATEDLRSGLSEAGVVHLKNFVQQGGLLITAENAAEFAIDEGMTPGVFVAPRKNLKVVGSVLNSVLVDDQNPIAYGYDSSVPLYSAAGLAFTVSNLSVNRNLPTVKEYKRPTGRGGPEDEDIPAGRPAENAPPLPAPKAWQPTPLNEDQERNNPFVIPAEYRPRVILRYAAMKDLLLSGLLENGDSIAEYPAVVQAHLGKGEVLLFANNPIYRGETIGSYALVFNALINFGHLR
jgi:hypothetical protein